MTANKKAYKNIIEILENEIRQACEPTDLPAREQLFLLFWKLGKHILDSRKAHHWGLEVVEDISRDLLRTFPTMASLSPQILIYMQALTITYPDLNFVHTVLFQMPQEDVKKRANNMEVSEEKRAEIRALLTNYK